MGSKYLGSLDFHHINPDEKEFSIGQRHMVNFELLQKELDKCILVCKNCHCEIHGGVINLSGAYGGILTARQSPEMGTVFR